MNMTTNRTERILTSTEGMKPAEAPPFLLTRIEARISEGVRYVGASKVRMALAAAVTLVMVNAGAMLWASRSTNESSPATGNGQSASAYQSGDLSLDAFNTTFDSK